MVESVTDAGAAAPKKPALLKGGMVLCWIYAVVLVLTLAMLPTISTMQSVEKKGTVSLPGDAVLHSDFVVVSMRSSSQVFIIPLLVVSIIVAYGLAKDRYWSRMMMMTLLILGVVLVPPEMANPAVYGASAALAVFGWWYLYRKPNVVAYYTALRHPTTKGN